MSPSSHSLKLRLRAAALNVLAKLDLDAPPREGISVVEQDDDSGTDLTMTLRPSGGVVNAAVGTNPLLSLFFSPLELAIVECLYKNGVCAGLKIAKLTRNLNGEAMNGPIKGVLPNLIGRGVLVNTHDSGYTLTNAARDIWERFFGLPVEPEPA